MWTAPRLTGALRAFGNVSAGQGATQDVRLGKDLTERKALALQEQSKSCVSWKKISDVVRQNADAGKAEVDEALKQLSVSAKAIAGVESSADTVESAAAYLFDVFKATQSVGQSEARNLRNTFGPYPASHATKACQIVSKIVAWLPEKKLQELWASSDQREDGDGAEMQEEFGAGIKFTMNPWPQDDDLSSSDDSEDEDTETREISLRYSGKTISDHKGSREKDGRVADGKDSIDSLWLQKQVKAYFSENTGLGLSAGELCTHIIDVLTSSRSDEALQNELFELLGFDRFEFIQLLLENRQTFVKNIAQEATREAMLQAPKPKKEEQRPAYGCQVTVQSAEERELQKQIRREEKRLNKKDGRKGDNADVKGMAFDPEEMKMVCEGDQVEVQVHNKLEGGEGTSIHWHGLHQRHSPHMDGVAMVTQCPIPAHSRFTYRFNATTPGTHFWHAHLGLQRADGLFGHFVIRQTSGREVHAGEYDEDLPEHAMVVNDWMVEMVAARFAHKHHGQGDNKPRAILVNGKGSLDPVTNDSGEKAFTPHEVFTVRSNQRYRFRAVSNGILNCPIRVSVDNHVIRIIATDGTPVKPFEVDSFNLFAGERFDFVLTANQTVGNYWIRVRGLADCGEQFKNAKTNAILRYQGAPLQPPTLPPHGPPVRNHDRPEKRLNPFNHRGNNHLFPVTELTSLVADDVTVTQEVPDKLFYIGMDFYYLDNPRFHHPSFYPVSGSKILQDSPQMNHISLVLPASPPLSQPGDVPESQYCNAETVGKNCSEEYCECVHRLQVGLGEVVEMVLVDEGVPWDASHPTHLHGHAFRVLAMDRLASQTTLQEVIDLDRRGGIQRNLKSPVLKDSVTVPDGGYTVIRFHANNPGVWLLHCHIEYHAEIGMGLVLQVGEPHQFPPPPPRFPTCGNWDFPAEDQAEADDTSSRYHNMAERSDLTEDNSNASCVLVNFFSVKVTVLSLGVIFLVW